MKAALVLYIGLLLLCVSHAAACYFAWNATTTNTDGTPITNLAGYRLYLGNVQQGADIPAPNTTATLPTACQLGTYTVTAFNMLNIESVPSLPFVVKQPGSPASLTVTK
jgi:hypothetical protein